jgi:oligopeptidase A
MAKNGAAALKFVEDLHDRVLPQFGGDHEALRRFVADRTGEDPKAIMPWSRSFWSEKLKKALYDFDSESLRPYFAVDRVLEGLFKTASTIYGIRVEESEPGSFEVYAPDVRLFTLFDAANGTALGHVYIDLYPRESKRQGAWVEQLEFGRGAPHIATLGANIARSVGGKPALLDHYEVTTLFHEFGHVCHLLLSESPFKATSSFSVPWDFVELPSQFLENWVWERGALDIFAQNEAGEKIPDELFARMIRARTFQTGLLMMRQLSFGKLDLELHANFERWTGNPIDQIDREVLAKYRHPDDLEVPSMAHSFGHLFSSPVAYAAGYYSYLWAEVLDADAFTLFQKNGVLNQELGGRFRKEILAKGATEPADVLFRNFMGRDPDPTAFLVRNGVTQK